MIVKTITGILLLLLFYVIGKFLIEGARLLLEALDE